MCPNTPYPSPLRWAAPLTRLRSVARIVRFNPALPTLLVKRLRDICIFEGLTADSRALTNLVTVCRGDMRGCLNTLQVGILHSLASSDLLLMVTLQFIQRKCLTVCEQTVRLATVGMKENEATMQDVWNDLFIPMAKKRVKDLGMTEEDEGRYVSRLSRLIGATGNTEKVVIGKISASFDELSTTGSPFLNEGCFEHYINLHQYDPTFNRCDGALKWLGAYDILSSKMRTEQEYALLEYLPYTIAPFYHHFANPTNPKAERPKMDWEVSSVLRTVVGLRMTRTLKCHVRTKTNDEIYSALASSALLQGGRQCPGHRHLFNRPVLQTELAPLLNRIISPPLKPVRTFLCSDPATPSSPLI